MLNNVVLIESGVFVVLHVLGNRKEEVGKSEGLNHLLNVVLDGTKLGLDVLDLVLLFSHLSGSLLDLLLESHSNDLFVLGADFGKFLVSLDFELNVVVLLFDVVDLRVQQVDVVVEGVVLLLSLDEGGDDFLSRGDTSLLLNLGESILNDVDVPNVHVHEVLLLFVVVGPLLESELQNSSGVCELTTSSLLRLLDLTSHGFGFGLLHLRLVSLLELFLEIIDLLLEVHFLGFVLGLEGEDLIVGILRDSLGLLGSLIELQGFLVNLTELFVVALIYARLVPLLFSHDVDLLAKILVLRLKLVVLDEVLVKSVLELLAVGVELLDLGSGRQLLKLGLLLLKLLISLFELILENHKAPNC